MAAPLKGLSVRSFRLTPGSPAAFAAAVLAVLAATVIFLVLQPVLAVGQITLLFLLVIVAVGRFAGVRASGVSAVLAFFSLFYFFVPPYRQWSVQHPGDMLTLFVFLLAALVAGMHTANITRRENESRVREREVIALNHLSTLLLSEQSVPEAADRLASEISSMTGATRVLLFLKGLKGAEAVGSLEPTFCESALAGWVVREDKAVGLPVREPGRASREGWPVSVSHKEAVDCGETSGMYLPLQAKGGIEGVLGVEAKADGGAFSIDDARIAVSAANLAAAFLERLRLLQVAEDARYAEESDRLKSSLMSSVSHELKTPLAAVKARVSALLHEGSGLSDPGVREELQAADADLMRLDASIADLLDISRLETDSWRPRKEPYEVGEIIGSMLKRLPASDEKRIVFDVPDGLPPVSVDFQQLSRAIQHLVENALAYSEGEVTVGARVLGGEMLVSVEDRGPGVPDEEKVTVFDKFRRGSTAEGHPSGTGLGLTVTREIVRANGGRVWVEDAEPAGARFVIALPLGGGE